MQTEGLSESYLNQQFQHLATMVSNISSFRPPHYNEVLLSWFRTMDPTYADFAKETDAQKTGYRRVYVGDMTGVSGEITDGSGNAVASFTDGKITKRTDKWIGITTCDSGGWLRLPLENSYKVSFSRADGKAISLKLTEYRVDDNKEVRTVTSDSKYDWSTLKAENGQSVVLNLSAVEAKDGSYELGDNGSEAEYSVTISDGSKDDPQKKDDSKDSSEKKDESKNSTEKKDDSKDSTQKIDNTRVKSPLTVKGKTVKIKASKVKKSTVRIARKKAITVKKAKGTVTYEKIKVLKGKKKASKKIAAKFTVKKKTGKITVKKGLKKEKYKLKIKVKDAGKGKYLPASKTATVTVVIK